MIHAYNGSYETMMRLTRIGCFISYTPAITDQRRTKLQKVFTRTPIEHLLLETDAPAKVASIPGNKTQRKDGWTMPAQIPDFYLWGAKMRETDVADFRSQLYSNAQIYTN